MNDNNKIAPYGYVYITTNLINNKQYIGQHKSSKFDSSYKSSGKILIQAMKKYGKENFSTKILEWCFSRDELAEREKHWIAFYNATNDNNWYNITSGGYGVQLFGKKNPMYGKHHTTETKKKISEKLTGLFAGEKNPMYGKPSPLRGIPQSEETRKKNSLAHIGKHPKISPETQKRLSELRSKRMSGQNNPQFGKKGKLSPVYGKHHTKEALKKMSDAHKGKNIGFENPACKPIYDINSSIVFSCIREVSEYFGLSYSQARKRIDKEIPISLNGHTYTLTRDVQKIRRW